MKRLFFIFGLLCVFVASAQKEYHLDDVLKSPNGIQNLNLSGEQLSSLPIEVRSCKKLKKLNLTNNHLQELPEWITEFSELEELNISGNVGLNIQKTFDQISALQALKTLKANQCKMVYLPIAIRHNKNLKHVEITNNFIKFLPPVFEQLNWESLDLSGNCIDTLPSSLVYMNSLKELNLSYCPAAYNRYNYYLLEYLTGMKTLGLSGMISIPEEISKLPFVEELILTNGTFDALPEGMKQLKKLKKVDARGCENLEVSTLITALSSSYRSMRELKIGHRNLNGLPYNCFKLKKLSRLYVDNSCISSLPSSINKFKGKEMHFRRCSFSTPEKVFGNFKKAKKIKKIVVNDCVFGHNSWSIAGSESIQQIDIVNCGLVRIPLDVQSFPKLKKLVLTGNRIPKSSVKWTTPKTILGAEYNSIYYAKKELKNWKYTAPKPETRRMIYSEVGDLFTLPSGTEIEIADNAFIQTGNKDVTGDVEVRIKEFLKSEDYLLSNFPTYLPTEEVSDVKYSIEIRAFQNGKEVYVKSNKPIVVQPQLKKNMALDKYYYLGYKKEWQKIDQQVNVCNTEQPDEVTTVCPEYEKYPEMNYNLRVSKVHLRIKRNKRKKTLNFDIEPEYGYLEKQINIFGDRIKGYPELKQYKGIKWRYVGDSLDRDLEKLYFLSESAKKEKMNRKSSFYFYVLDIKDIRVFPNPEADNYLLQFIQGRDTFSVPALPFLPLLKAKKIQRWHKRKYKKYRKALAKRKLKWIKLDTTYFNDYELFETSLEQYRQYKVKQQYVVKKDTAKNVSGQKLKIYKPGLYALSIPLLINKGEVKKPIYYIKGKRFKPRRVLVNNKSKGYSYWCNGKGVVKERGVYEISVFVDGEIYKGKWGRNNKVEFKLVE